MAISLRVAMTTIIATLATNIAVAQSRTISGRIVDKESGENVAFANIAEAHTGRGTTTNADGYFSISAEGGIKISCIGYEPRSLDMGEIAGGDRPSS